MSSGSGFKVNVNKIDEFLYKKSKIGIDRFFSYLSPIMELAKQNNNDLSKCEKERDELLKSFNNSNVDYQIEASTFIIELFHVLEIYLKAVLYINGEYLIFKSIDDYPKQKAKLEADSKKKEEILKSLYGEVKKAVRKGKEDRAAKIAKQFAPMLIESDVDITFSVSPLESMNRLINYLKWNVTEEMYNKYKSLIECRNEVVHFAIFRNVTLSCSLVLSLIFSFSKSLPNKFPMFSKIIEEYSSHTDSFSESIIHIGWGEAVDVITEKAKKLESSDFVFSPPKKS